MNDTGYIQRTLRGVGGIRLIEHPGVHYPLHMLKAATGMDKRTGRPWVTPPPWAISTREAAAILGVSDNSTRLWLRRHGISYYLVSSSARQPTIYWQRSEVEKLAQKRPPVCADIPPGMIDTAGALKMLNVGRSSLYRYVQQGKLRQMSVRGKSRRGPRLRHLYYRSEVRKLAAHMHAIHTYQKQISNCTQHYMIQAPASSREPHPC